MGAGAITGLQGVGTLFSVLGQAGAGDADQAAAEINAQNIEFNARQVKEQRLEEEKNFLSAMRRDQAQNVLGIAASGIRLEGSPLDVLRENTRNSEKDAANIRLGTLTEQQAFARQASGERRRGREAGRAANIGAAASLLSGAGETADTGKRLGVF